MLRWQGSQRKRARWKRATLRLAPNLLPLLGVVGHLLGCRHLHEIGFAVGEGREAILGTAVAATLAILLLRLADS